MVSAPGDKGPLQWQLSSVLGGEQQECPLQSLRAGILEWHLELLLDLLLGLDAFPLDAVPRSSLGSSKRLAYMAGSGPHHCVPFKCACRGPPVQYTTGGVLVAQVTPPHQQCSIIHCPRKVFEVASVIDIQQGQGIRHALLL